MKCMHGWVVHNKINKCDFSFNADFNLYLLCILNTDFINRGIWIKQIVSPTAFVNVIFGTLKSYQPPMQ